MTTQQPFTVPTHAHMLAQCAGKVPGTVLTMESLFYTTRICEYTQPLMDSLRSPQAYGRFWCFESVAYAIAGLAAYLNDEAATEPDGWIKAVDFVDGYRVRRARLDAAGNRIITVEEPD